MRGKLTMTLLHKIITVVLATALISSPFLQTNDSFKQANATDSNQNLFLRVDDINDLKAGDKVIIANHFGAILDHFGGNPTYLCSRDYGGGSGLGDKYFLTGALSDYQVLNVGKTNDYFTFQFTYVYSYYWDKVVCKDKYLCYRQSDGYWDSDKGKVYLYGDLYFTDNPNHENSQWKIIPNFYGDGFFNMQRSGEADGTFITYQSGTTRDRFWYGGTQGQYQSDYGVRIYKYVNLDDYQHIFNTNDISQPNRTTFYQGEEIDLTGLEFNVYLLDKNFDINESTDIAAEAIYTIHSKYEQEKSLYSTITIEGSGESTRAVFSYMGFGYRVFIKVIQESAEITQYHLMNYSTLDYRGTYYFGYITQEHPVGEYGEIDEEYTVLVINGSTTGIGSQLSGLAMNIATQIIDVPSSASANVSRSRFQVKRVVIAGESKTYLYNSVADQYISYNDGNELCYVSESQLTNKEVFSVIDNQPALNGNMYIVFGAFGFTVSSNPDNAAKMFKLMPKSSFYSELDTFKTLFFNKIQCIADGQTNFTQDNWLETKTAFDTLSVDIQGYLANLTYIHNGEESGSIGDMIDRYDYILSKYQNTYVDYMNRKEAAYHNFYLNSQNISDNQSIQQNTNLIIIFITIGLLTFVPIAFFAKKKKS